MQEWHLQIHAKIYLNPSEGRKGLTISLNYVSIILIYMFIILIFQPPVPLLLTSPETTLLFSSLLPLLFNLLEFCSISIQSTLGKISSSPFLPICHCISDVTFHVDAHLELLALLCPFQCEKLKYCDGDPQLKILTLQLLAF